MTPSPTNSPGVLRLDPCQSKVFSWISWDPESLEIRDEVSGRLIQPAGPALTVRYRTTGAEWTAWPVSEEEAHAVMQPGSLYDFSSGRAYSQLILPRKSKRMIKPSERRATSEQRAEVEKRAGRRWLA
jgi:hypothetical protein